MTAIYTFDVFSSLDGYGSYGPGGDWGGYWGKQGPELLEHRLASFGPEQRMVFGATTPGPTSSTTPAISEPRTRCLGRRSPDPATRIRYGRPVMEGQTLLSTPARTSSAGCSPSGSSSSILGWTRSSRGWPARSSTSSTARCSRPLGNRHGRELTCVSLHMIPRA